MDIYIGQGGAPEGVLAAAALRCVGGQMQTRLVFRNDGERARAERFGITDLNRRYDLPDLAAGDVVFSATGVTNGSMLRRRACPPDIHHHPFHGDALGDQNRALGENAASDRQWLTRWPGLLSLPPAPAIAPTEFALGVEYSFSGRSWRMRGIRRRMPRAVSNSPVSPRLWRNCWLRAA